MINNTVRRLRLAASRNDHPRFFSCQVVPAPGTALPEGGLRAWVSEVHAGLMAQGAPGGCTIEHIGARERAVFCNPYLDVYTWASCPADGEYSWGTVSYRREFTDWLDKLIMDSLNDAPTIMDRDSVRAWDPIRYFGTP